MELSRVVEATNERAGEADAGCGCCFGDCLVPGVHDSQREQPVAIVHEHVLGALAAGTLEACTRNPFPAFSFDLSMACQTLRAEAMHVFAWTSKSYSGQPAIGLALLPCLALTSITKQQSLTGVWRLILQLPLIAAESRRLLR